MEKTYKGFIQAKCGDELYVNTEDDEMVTLVVKDKELRNDLYCTHVIITVKTIDE